MKKSFLYFLLLCAGISGRAQEQFTNFGNFKTFSGASITFFGNFKNDGSFTDDGQAVSFKGSSGQSISGTSVTTLTNLVVDASASNVTLSQNVIISNSMALTSGQLNLNSKTLTITNNAATALSRTNGYILSEQTDNSSKVIWTIGTNTSSHVFPFGTTAGAYIPFTLAVTAGDIGNVTVSTFPTAADNTPYPTTPISVTHLNAGASDNSANVVDRFWQIDKDGPSGTATLTFEATAAEVGTIGTLRAQRWNSSTGFWDDVLPGQSNTATSVTVPGVSTFSPWALSGNNTPMPIELTSFTATPVGSSVELNWITSSEINNDYFTVQRSLDGINFYPIANVPGAGTSSAILKYDYIDFTPLSGRSYYRLKQTDFNGDYEFSDIRVIEFDHNSQVEFIAYPNPVTDKFTISGTSDNLIRSITIFNASGKILGTKESERNSKEDFDLSNNPAGLYLVKIVHDLGLSYIKVVKE